MAGVTETMPGTVPKGLTTVSLSNWFAETMLADCQTAITAQGLTALALNLFITGGGVNIFDCCNGMLWTRLANFYPSNGNGAAFTQARPDFDIPAWVYVVEIGVLQCHQNLDEQGNMVDPTVEQALAERDGDYMRAIYTAVTTITPGHIEPCALGYTLSPWRPIGPDGGCSGGILNVSVISTGLAVDI